MSAQVTTGPLHGRRGDRRTDDGRRAHQLPARAEARRSRPYDGVPEGDRRRVDEVADHVDLWLGLVHHHHTIEDELLWDRLAQRVPDELAPWSS